MAHWKAVINLITIAITTMLKPMVKDTRTPIDDVGVDALLAILNTWQKKEGE